jgi:hypothetical protein
MQTPIYLRIRVIMINSWQALDYKLFSDLFLLHMSHNFFAFAQYGTMKNYL